MRIFNVDAFTATRYTGNPAIVVLDADAQTDTAMQALAREFAYAEVAFVTAATAPDHDVRVRFFNTRHEAPFVGHATLAAHAVLLASGARGAGIVRQLCGTGIMEVRVELPRSADARPMIEFRQGRAQLDAPLPLQTVLRIAEALRLPATRLHESLPARVARKGSTRLLLPVSRCADLDELAPQIATLLALGKDIGADGFFAFAVEATTHELSTESRMFCPALGINEDPVSGNAHAMLASYLWEAGFFTTRATAFVGRQGRHVQRPGEVHVQLDVARGELAAVRIGGSAVLVTEGVLLP